MSTPPAPAPSHDWPAVLDALEFTQQQYEWAAPGLIAADRLPALRAAHQDAAVAAEKARQEGRPLPDDLVFLATDRCPGCGATVARTDDYCTGCGLKVQSPAVQSHRRLTFFLRQVTEHEQAGRLALYEAHTLRGDVKAQLRAARVRMDRERAVPVFPVEPPPPRRPPLEILLDPKNTQWLLAVGGALFVVGLVTWLATLGLFERPEVVAGLLGAGNLALLGGGWALLLRTRYQTAGRALTLLACLLLPLNLWFYHANHLITLEGHLWLAALPICALYAASARVLKDELFAPVFLGGVTLTGLLLLADLGKFWEIAAPVALLASLGLAAIHSERAFPAEGDGPFTRRRFGLAFFWSGHVLLLGGLLLLLGAQFAGHWLYEPVFRPLYEQVKAAPSPVVTEPWGQLLALTVVLAAVYAYVWSDLVVRRIGLYLALAASCLVWAEVLAVELLHLPLGPEVMIATLAGTGLLVNLTAHRFARERATARVLPTLGLLLTLLPVLLGVGLHLRATAAGLAGWGYEPSWGFVAALALAAASARVGAFVHRREPGWAATYLGATAAATLVGFAGLLALLGLHGWVEQAPWLMQVPLAYVIAVNLYGERSPARPLYWVGHAATAFMLVSSLSASVTGFALVQQDALNLRLAVFFAEAALFYGLAALARPRSINVHLGTAAAAAAVWQLLNFAGVGTAYYPPVFAALGLALLVAYRLAILERSAGTGLAVAAFQGANALVSLAFVAAALRVLSELAVGLVAAKSFAELWPILALVALTVAAAGLVGHAGWRRWYVAAAVAEALLAVLVLNVLIDRPAWRKLEIFSALVGAGLVTAGLVGWHRERGGERHSDLVDFALGFGCLLVGLPLTLVALTQRFHEQFVVADEAAMLVAGLLLLAVGLLLRLKAPTITGGLLTLLYLVGMVLFVRFREIQTAALVLTCGGGALFLTGLALSVFRDRLLTLPGRVQRREGVFRVLGWR